MATASETPALLQRTKAAPIAAERRAAPVLWWAGAGGLLFALVTYIMVKWVTGPYFERVDPGPSDVPEPQQIALLAIQIGGTALAIGCIYWFLIRPWRRDGKPTSEGLLALCYGLLYWQDPVSISGGQWFTYNATMFNMGSWVNSMPLYTADGGQPGNMIAEPIFGMGSGYVYFWILGVAAAFLTFRMVKQHWPRVGTLGAIVASYFACVLFDVVLEGFVWMRTGFYAYPGAPGPHLFSGSFMAYPIVEGLLIGCLLVPYAVLRYYKDDRGYTIVERGIDTLRVGSKTKVLIRFMAMFAVANAIYFFCYNIWAYEIGTHQQAWPKEVQERSYLLNGVCGGGNDRLCPSPALPNQRDGAAFINLQGGVTVPAGKELPPAVPIDRGKPGPGE